MRLSRLEEIKRLWDENNDVCGFDDYEWLIQQAELYEECRADAMVFNERVYELGNRLYKFSRQNYELSKVINEQSKENQRYKQALEDIKRILDTYPHVDYSKGVTRRRLFDLANEALKGGQPK